VHFGGLFFVFIIKNARSKKQNCSYYSVVTICGSLNSTLLSPIYFCTFKSALPAVCVQYPILLFSVVPWFRALQVCLLRGYFVYALQLVTNEPAIISSITSVFTPHMCCIYTVRSLNFKILLSSCLITFLFSLIALPLNRRVRFSLSRITMPSLLLGMVFFGLQLLIPK